MPKPLRDPVTLIQPDPDSPAPDLANVADEQDSREPEDKKQPSRSPRNFVPIIMSFLFILLAGSGLFAQLELDVALETTYTDNVYQLSEYDLNRFDEEHPNLDYVQTSDDLTLAATIDAAYPIRYQWWTFTPSVSATFSQNVSNTDKQRRDALLRFRVDRYYWNFTAIYGYYPEILVRQYVDTDGTDMLEHFSYERNLYRGDLNIKPWKGTTLQLHAKYEQLFYNQYWTEFDGNATTLGAGIRHSFPVFSVGGSYYYRSFDNTAADNRDSSYDSNIYNGDLRLHATPLNDTKPKGAAWYPSLKLSYEERFFQSLDSWYGGRADKIYTTNAALNFDIDPNWKLILDYSHTFRNVESPVAAVRRAREYSENRVSAQVKYSF